MESKSEIEMLNNIKDSLFHALAHFSELAINSADSAHHKKWIVLSVHHAAEIYLYVVLSAVSPQNELLKKTKKNGKPWFPSSTSLLEELNKFKANLSKSEVKLLSVLNTLIGLRHDLMHNPKSIIGDISPAVWSTLALLRAISRRYGISTEEIFNFSPPIEIEVLDLLKWEHLSEYSEFVEQVLAEEFPDKHDFLECPNCGACAVTMNRCEGCFENINMHECHSCGQEFATFRDPEPKCPSCGARV